MLRAQVYNFPDGLDARYPFEVTWSNPDETFICAYDLTFEKPGGPIENQVAHNRQYGRSVP